jgi:hypothetical protein
MKPILKLLFVALLIGVALEMPTKVKASGGEYNCSNEYFGQCMTSTTQWMGQCAYGCTYENNSGGTEQVCFTTIYSGCLDNGDGTCTYYESPYSDCENVPYYGASCVSGCASTLYEMQLACVSEYCTPD